MMIVEFAAGVLTGSLMLLSDAIHMLSHASALGVSVLALLLGQRKTGDDLPFGLFRVEILAALLNGIGLAGFSVWIVYEAVMRLLHPVAVLGPTLTAVACIGLVVNLITAVILSKAGLEDVNTKSAFLHMLADTFSSLVIVAGGIILSLTGWSMIDPLLSILVAGIVAKWSWGLLQEASLIFLERKPNHLNWHGIQQSLLREFPQVKNVHDSHIWEITSQFTCLSAHIVLEDMKLSEAHRIRAQVADYLAQHYSFGHVVVQLEC
jgi:cobalt-zinc-cadmium efflux system protein